MNEDEQDSRQPRRGLLSHGIDAINAGRTIGQGIKIARVGGAAAGVISANIWIIVGGIIIGISLLTFILTLSGGSAAGIPESGGEKAESTATSPTLACSAGIGPCSPQNLAEFGSNAGTASIVCYKESTGISDIVNRNCLLPSSDKRQSLDYSVGLFQINLIAQCYQAFSPCTATDPSQLPSCPGTKYCEIANQSILDECIKKYSSVEENKRFALDLSKNGTNWSAWGAAHACGIL